MEANATHEDSDAPKWECFSIEVIDQPENMASLTHPGDSIDYENDWIDYGCSYHARGDVNLLSNVKSHEGKRVIVTTDNSLHPIMKEGKFEGNCTLKDAYHVPGLKKNLAFVSQITNSDKYVLFCPKDVKIFDNLKYVDVDVLVTGKKKNSLYVLSISDVYVQKTSRNTSPSVWHAWLGHIGYQLLQQISTKNMLNGVPMFKNFNIDVVCAGCQYGKSH